MSQSRIGLTKPSNEVVLKYLLTAVVSRKSSEKSRLSGTAKKSYSLLLNVIMIEHEPHIVPVPSANAPNLDAFAPTFAGEGY